MADLKRFIIIIIPLMPQRLHGKLHQTKMFSQYRCYGDVSHINFRPNQFSCLRDLNYLVKYKTKW